MSEYGIIRCWMASKFIHEAAPATVMLIERETARFAFGWILHSNAETRQTPYSYAGYDTVPSHDGKIQGRVKLERVIARFPTFEQASTALKAAQRAWAEVEEAAREQDWDLSQSFRDADAILREERKRLEAELVVKLADTQRARDEALAAFKDGRVAMHQKMLEAAVAAAAASVAVSGETTAPPA